MSESHDVPTTGCWVVLYLTFVLLMPVRQLLDNQIIPLQQDIHHYGTFFKRSASSLLHKTYVRITKCANIVMLIRIIES